MMNPPDQIRNTEHRCPACDRPIEPFAPEGLCMACLLDAGFEEDRSKISHAQAPGPHPPVSGPHYFGDYELMREAGRGGMGVVFEARQFGTNRVLALKLLAAGVTATREAVQRFFTEAQAVARLEHSHIVSIHEVGAHEGQYFLAMRFLPGGTLAQAIAKSPLPLRRAAALVQTLAQALHHAHQHGVLHRDLKPGNILLDEAGNAYLTDFGLARLSGFDARVTLTSSIIGTAAYMAPEQASGGAASITIAADIYGMGAVLYELLAGTPPFRGESVADTLRMVHEELPAHPSLLRNQRANGKGLSDEALPADLETICLKCLEKDPAKRYATAQDLADDLGRFLKGEPVRARPVTRLEQAWRWCRRKPVLAASLAVAHLLLLLILIGSPLAAIHIRRERDHAEAEALRARRSEYAGDMILAQQALAENNLGRAVGLIEKHRPSDTLSRDLRGWEWRHLAALTRGG